MFGLTKALTKRVSVARFSTHVFRNDKLTQLFLARLSDEAAQVFINPAASNVLNILGANDVEAILSYLITQNSANLRFSAFRQFKNNPYHGAALDGGVTGKLARTANVNLAVSTAVNYFPGLFKEVVGHQRHTAFHVISGLADGLAPEVLTSLQSLDGIEEHINTRDKRGNTPLHKSLAGLNAAFSRWLIAQGADATIENDEGESCLDVFNQAIAKRLDPERSVAGVGRWTVPAPDLPQEIITLKSMLIPIQAVVCNKVAATR